MLCLGEMVSFFRNDAFTSGLTELFFVQAAKQTATPNANSPILNVFFKLPFFKIYGINTNITLLF